MKPPPPVTKVRRGPAARSRRPASGSSTVARWKPATGRAYAAAAGTVRGWENPAAVTSLAFDLRRPSPAHERLICAAIAGTLAALLAWLGPPGSDLAAHAYQ